MKKMIKGAKSAALEIANAAIEEARDLAVNAPEDLGNKVHFGVKWEGGRAVGEYGYAPDGFLWSDGNSTRCAGAEPLDGEILTHALCLVATPAQIADAILGEVEELAEADREYD